MSERRQARGSARTSGLLIAVAMAVVFAGVVGYYLITTPKGVRQAITPGEIPPDVRSIEASKGGPGGESLAGGRGMLVQFTRKDDPSKPAGEIRSVRVEPLEGKRYRFEKPRSLILMKNGRIAHVAADTGVLYMPTMQQEPESGVLDGDVVIRLYDPPTDVASFDPETQKPIFTFTTNALEFDGVLGQITAPGRIAGRSPTVDLDVTGLRALFSQTRERVEYLEIAQGDRIVYRPKPGTRLPVGASPGPQPPLSTLLVAAAIASLQPAATPANEAFYETTLERDVSVVRADGRIDADQLTVWMHLIDNELAGGAIGSPAQAEVQAAGTPTPAGVPDSSTSVTTDLTPTPDAEIAARPEVVITWKGTLISRPSDTRQDMLAHDELALRFSSSPGQVVTFADPVEKAAGAAPTLDYFATRRIIALDGGGERSVVAHSEAAGSIGGDRLEIGLASGEVRVAGKGELSDAGIERQQRITWTEDAVFLMTLRDGTLSTPIREASLTGEATATDGENTLRADTVRAWFSPDNLKDPVLERLLASGAVSMSGRNGSSLDAAQVDVAFSTDPAAPNEPRALAAMGEVRATDGRSRLECETLDAELVRTASKELEAQRAIATGSVIFTGRDGVRSESDRLVASSVAQTAELDGSRVIVSKGDETITTTHITLDGQSRTAISNAAGTYSGPAGDAAGTSRRAEASWSKHMSFNDEAGRLECDGDVRATIRQDRTEDTVRAARVAVDLTPSPKDSPASDRRVLRFEASGSDSSPAVVEFKRFDVASNEASDAKATRLLHLESSLIIADDAAQTVSAPAAGKLLVFDRRAGEDAASTPSAMGRGDALFQWSKDLLLDRRAGTVTLNRQVRMIHVRRGDNTQTELESETLVARFNEHAATTSTGESLIAGDIDLTGAIATGAVWARSRDAKGQREITADTIDYNAATSVLDAFAQPGGVVTLFDAGTTAPVTAKSLRWDLGRSRIDIDVAGPIVVPR